MPFPHKFGWIPDLPDARDYTKDTPKVKEMLLKQKIPASLPAFVDLRAFCPPIFDQGQPNSSEGALLQAYRRHSDEILPFRAMKKSLAGMLFCALATMTG